MMSAVGKNLVAGMLALVMGVTSIGLASARGQTHIGGQVVICSGGRLLTVTLDANGEPMGPTHICPDMALGLLAAISEAPTEIARPQTSGAADRIDALAQTIPGTPTPSRARAPPVLS